MIDWQSLLTAFALYLILEGILPFINPAGFRHFIKTMSQLDDASIRKIGSVSMGLGVILLILIR